MQPGFLEFFAGIGLVHLGLRSGGWQCVYANDISDKKRQMYLDEMPETAEYFHLEDIWNTDAVMAQIKQSALLATASFPCTDLSLAGNQRGIKGEHSSTLFGFLKVMKQMKADNRMPPCLMLENVTGLLTGHQGKDFVKVCEAVSELGFFIDAFVIDAKHFTPQSRPRLFIVGVLKEMIPPEVPVNSKLKWQEIINNRGSLCPFPLAAAMKNIKLPTGWIAFDLPSLPPEQKNLASIIDLDDGQDWWEEKTTQDHINRFSDLHGQRIDQVIKSHKSNIWVSTIYRRMRNNKMMAEIRFDGLAGCLRTPRGGSGKQIVIVVDKGKIRMRWMSPIEYARLQGAPDFNIRVPRNQALMGFADAVCVPVIEWVDRYVLSHIAVAAGLTVSKHQATSSMGYQPSLFALP